MEKKASVFPSPYEISAPKGAEDWQEMYPYYMRFQPDKRKEDEDKFWFCNNQHWPVPLRPFDMIMLEYSQKTLGQYNTRHLLIPPANGIECKMINGYVYMSMVPVAPQDIEARVPHFMERAGHYFSNWTDLLEAWEKKVRGAIAELETVQFETLPDMVPLDWIKEGRGTDNASELLENFDKALTVFHRVWQYHFEFLNLGYAAYVDFFGFVKEQFPSVPDQAIAKMVQGVDSILFRPDDELKKLSQMAVVLDITEMFKSGDVTSVLAAVAKAPKGQEWLDAWEAAQDPWFNFSTGSGLLSTDKRWNDDLNIPLDYIREYIDRLVAGEDILRPTERLQTERDRMTTEYRELMDEDMQEVFDGKLGLARTVFPYVEDHNFFIEHWSMGVFWRKMRELSKVLSQAGFWPDEDGMFFVKRSELREILWDYCNAWASGIPVAGDSIWPAVVDKRRKMLDVLGNETPAPALNNPPEEITEPFTIMLWGITSEAIERWAGSQNSDDTGLTGMAASPGVVEGIARVLRDPDQLKELKQGEILVAPVTAPSWAPVFGKIGAAVTDIGGIMSHAAIVCREYGLPAVTGTGFASARIKTGMKLRVDGNKGTVTVIG
jgi:pyruvate,water dikinase